MSDQPPSGRIEDRAHLLPVRVYYEDTDFSGLVYHANYLRFFERGRSDFLRVAGVDHVALLAEDTAITVLEMTVKFRAAARIDDALLVRTEFHALEGPRFIINQAITKADASLVAEAQVTACCISSAGRAKRPPPLLVEKIIPYLDPARSRF